MSLAAGGHAMRAAGAQPGGVYACRESGLAGVWSRVNRRSPGRMASDSHVGGFGDACCPTLGSCCCRGTMARTSAPLHKNRCWDFDQNYYRHKRY